MRFFTACFMSILLIGCANGGSMRFERGPNLEDGDFNESLAKLSEFTGRMEYSYGEIRYAPVAQIKIVGGRTLDVQRLLVMDGGLFLVSHNMIDDQFYPVAYAAYSQVSEFSVGDEVQGVIGSRHSVMFVADVHNSEEALTFEGDIWDNGQASEIAKFVNSRLKADN